MKTHTHAETQTQSTNNAQERASRKTHHMRFQRNRNKARTEKRFLAGKSDREISDALGISLPTIREYLKELGLRQYKTQNQWSEAERQQFSEATTLGATTAQLAEQLGRSIPQVKAEHRRQAKFGTSGGAWTAADHARVIHMAAQGVTIKDIATALQRTANSIKRRTSRFGIITQRAAAPVLPPPKPCSPCEVQAAVRQVLPTATAQRQQAYTVYVALLISDRDENTQAAIRELSRFLGISPSEIFAINEATPRTENEKLNFHATVRHILNALQNINSGSGNATMHTSTL